MAATEFCPRCGEEVYSDQLDRHMAKDISEENDEREYLNDLARINHIVAEYHLGVDTIMSLVDPI